MKAKNPKFKIGDIVWYASVIYNYHKMARGRILDIHYDGRAFTIRNPINGEAFNSEVVFAYERCVSKSKKETERKLLERKIECAKRTIQEENKKMLKLQIELAKIT